MHWMQSVNTVSMGVAGYPEMTNMAYLASSGLCIGAIGCLSNQKTARIGNALGLMGVGGGVAATLGAIGGDAALYGQIAGNAACMLAGRLCTSCGLVISANYAFV